MQEGAAATRGRQSVTRCVGAETRALARRTDRRNPYESLQPLTCNTVSIAIQPPVQTVETCADGKGSHRSRRPAYPIPSARQSDTMRVVPLQSGAAGEPRRYGRQRDPATEQHAHQATHDRKRSE